MMKMLIQTLLFSALLSTAHSGESTTGFTDEDKADILTRHNELRAAVSPQASNMLQLVWDDELASMAQEWADLCTTDHGNPSRDPAPFGGSIGQNIWTTSAPIFDAVSPVNSWYSEVADYDYGTNTCNGVCGHYTQVVWANSYALGCGVAQCGPDNNIVVCNYGPAGNWVGYQPYASGTPCADCLSHTGLTSVKCNDAGNLCEICITAEDSDCQCTRVLECQNEGTWDRDSCSCLCASGFVGGSCQYQCPCVPKADQDDRCASWASLNYCTEGDYIPYMRGTCGTTCNYCYTHPACNA